jgi:hypothetical protein
MTAGAVWGRSVRALRNDEIVSRDLTLPPDYADLLADLKGQVRSAQLRARRVVNTELLTLYWRSVSPSAAGRRSQGGAPRSLTSSRWTCARSSRR